MENANGRVYEMANVLGGVQVSDCDGRMIASPKTTEEVAAILRYADTNSLRVETAGAGTKRLWVGTVSGNVVLQTQGLAGVREHSWQDLTATVGAGTAWGEMQRVLAQHGQMVALDPLWSEQATVGGVIAVNDSGALRLRYGSLRDLLIGMTVVLADGTVARSGGKVVKNVAGYDLHKLMIGAFGTLAVISEVTFRLHSIPKNTRTWTLEAADANVCGAVLMKVLDSQLSVQAMQMRASTAGFALDVELMCSEDEVLNEQLRVLDVFAGRAGVVGRAVFGGREQLFAGEGVVVKVTMLASAIAGLSTEVVRLGGEAITQATGIMLARFTDTDAIERLRELIGPEGSVGVLRGMDGTGSPARVKSAGALMREIKRRFDAKGTLNPGVVIG